MEQEFAIEYVLPVLLVVAQFLALQINKWFGLWPACVAFLVLNSLCGLLIYWHFST